MRNNNSRITELSCWRKRIIGVVISFVFVGTCLRHSFRLATVQRFINQSCYDLKNNEKLLKFMSSERVCFQYVTFS